MKQNSFLINTPHDALATLPEGGGAVALYVSPQGTLQTNEISDTFYPAGTRIPYHVHKSGWETFVIEEGRCEVILYGKRFVMEKGDLLHIEPNMPHGFYFPVETIWREHFLGMTMFGCDIDRRNLETHAMHLLEDDAFMKRFRERHNFFRLPEPVGEDAEPGEIPQLIRKGCALQTFTFDSITLRLLVGRWQTGGAKEIWEWAPAPGMEFSFLEPSAEDGIYLVKQGKILVQAGGEVFLAKPSDIVHIPPYTPYIITVIDKDTVIHDYNCTTQLFKLLELIESAYHNDPEKRNDAAWLHELAGRSPLTACRLNRKLG